MGDSYLKQSMLKVSRKMRIHKLIPLVVVLQILLVLFSKVCWLVFQLSLSNKYLHKLVMGSAGKEFPDIYGGKGQREIEMGKISYYEKYSKAFVTMNGENAACLWVANRKCIEGIKMQIERGQKEGNSCDKLVTLLKNKSCSSFKNPQHQKSLLIKLEVEDEFDVCQCSCKMKVASIIRVIIELCPFIQDVEKAIGAVEACSQAWNIMDLVENSDTEAFQISKAADKLFKGLQKRGEFMFHHHVIFTPTENSFAAARVVVENLAEKTKKIAEDSNYRTWNEVVEGYSLWSVCMNIDFENFTKVEGIIDELVRMLADEMGSCMGKAFNLIMEDCEKWATMAMEQRIWIAAHVAGKVKSIAERSGWMLACNTEETIKNASSSSIAFPTLRRRPNFQIG